MIQQDVLLLFPSWRLRLLVEVATLAFDSWTEQLAESERIAHAQKLRCTDAICLPLVAPTLARVDVGHASFVLSTCCSRLPVPYLVKVWRYSRHA
eukprot:5638396-Prymnesium_polylepis.2